MFKMFKTEKMNYALYGFLFGLLFPLFGTLIHTIQAYESLSLNNMIHAQMNEQLLWIIDTAPFWLSLFAMYAGMQMDIIKKQNAELEVKVAERTEKLNEELEKYMKLVIEKADSDLDAANSKTELEELQKKINNPDSD